MNEVTQVTEPVVESTIAAGAPTDDSINREVPKEGVVEFVQADDSADQEVKH